MGIRFGTFKSPYFPVPDGHRNSAIIPFFGTERIIPDRTRFGVPAKYTTGIAEIRRDRWKYDF